MAGALERTRGLCLARPETSERLSHGAPSFFVRGKKTFVMVLDIITATVGSPLVRGSTGA